jgi:hypothetical protein
VRISSVKEIMLFSENLPMMCIQELLLCTFERVRISPILYDENSVKNETLIWIQELKLELKILKIIVEIFVEIGLDKEITLVQRLKLLKNKMLFEKIYLD